MYKLKQNNLIKLILFAIAVFYSGYAMYTMVGSLKYLLVATALVLSFLLFSTENSTGKSFSIVLFFLISSLIVMTVNLFEGITTYFVLIALIFIAYEISRSYDFYKIINLFLHFMTVVAVFSLIGYVLANKTSLLDNLPKRTNTNDVQYSCGYIFFFIPTIKERNCGVFWEPGIFATFLVLAIAFEAIFKKGKINYLRILLFSITTISTQSSAGYVLLLVGIILVFLTVAHQTKKASGKFLAYFIIFAVILLLLFSNFIIRNTSLANNVHFKKLLFENILEQSRVKAFSHNIEIFLDNPIFGAGFQVTTDSMAHVADTSTTTYIMSVFGVFGLAHIVMLTVGVAKIKGIDPISKIVFWLLMVLIINKEPHLFNLFTWIFMFYLVNGVSFANEKLTLKNRE